MHISLRMKNWRSIAAAEVELTPLTVIVGRNSSGKSNLVDALLFASEVGRDASTAVSRRGGIASIRRWSPSKPYDVTIDVRVARSRDVIERSYARHEMVMKSGRDGAWHFVRELALVVEEGATQLCFRRTTRNEWTTEGGVVRIPRAPAQFPIDDTTSVMLYARQSVAPLARARSASWLSNVRALRPVPELMRRPQTLTDATKLDETASNITTALHRLSEQRRQEVVGVMSRVVPGLLDVRAQESGRYLTLVFSQQHEESRRPDFAATEMSDGALRALAVIVAAKQMSPNELLVIEEPEVNLHPGAARVIYDVLQDAARRGAVLITTHSPELLDHAKDDNILVCEYVDGTTRIGPLDESQRALVRDGLFNTAELMRTEELRREGAPTRVVRGVM